MDFTQSMDNGYMIPTSVAVGSGEATDIRCVCDTVEDFKAFLDTTGMELRYEGLVTYEKVNKLLKVYKGNDTWQTVGEGVGNVDTSSFITLTQLSQQLSNYYTKSQTDNKIAEEIAKAQLSNGNSNQEPLEDDIPKVFLVGDNFSNMTNSKNEVDMDMEYISKTQRFKSSIKIKFQGTSSLSYPKKNFTIKMFEDSSYSSKLKKEFKDWGVSSNKYVLKANYIDLSHSRNIVSARLWGDVVRSRTDYEQLPAELQNAPNQGAIDGFFVKLYVNGEYQGRYTWNLGKDDIVYGVSDKNNNHCILCGENYESGCFRALPMIDGNDWSDELHDTTPSNIKTSWSNAISFVMNSNDEEFKANLPAYFDVNSLIDYYCFQYAICGLDSMGKNQIYVTYDGIKWFACSYDMDSTWGLYWNGGSFVNYDYKMQEDYESGKHSNGNLLYLRLENLFSKEIYNRYKELRSNPLSLQNIINKFERFYDVCSKELIEEDYEIYTGIPSRTTNNIKQIRNFAKDRLSYVDSKIVELIGDKSVTSIDITGPSTVSVGSNISLNANIMPRNAQNKNVTWTKNNNNVNIVENGLTCVVEGVLEGNSIITCTSEDSTNGEIKKSYSINIVDVAGIEPVYTLEEKNFDGLTDFVNTGIKLFDYDKDFSIFIDFTDNLDNSDGSHAVKTILHCMKEVSPWNGITLDGNMMDCLRIACAGESVSLLDAEGKYIPYYSNINQKYVLVKESGSQTLKIYNYNRNVVQELVSSSLTEVIENDLLLGCYQTTEGVKGRFWKGKIHNFKVWDIALSQEYVNNIFNR